ncbi:hypothetical protein [Desulfobacula sp.]|uniref:hypothetical protein n=1 Tax=Desulfobacula sp. TaxID=2593537 RepID=UPI002601C8F5|nr:hypothetical protein [Desulfobacula sp.]
MPDKYPDLKNLCTACKKRDICKKLCQQALNYVNQDGKVYELQDEDEIKVFPLWNEKQASTANSDNQDGGVYQANHLETTFTDDPENNPFSEFNPDHQITQVFLLRFFEKWSFSDIAEKFDLKDKDAAKSIYFRAISRLKEGLEVIDERTLTRQNALTSLKNSPAARQLNPAQKEYLLYAVFNLDVETICEITGRKFGTVRSGIYRVKKYLDSGKYTFDDLVKPGQWQAKAVANSLHWKTA